MSDYKEKKFFDEYINLQRKKADLRLKEIKLQKRIREHRSKIRGKR